MFPKVTWGKTLGLTTNSSSIRRISSFAKAIKSLQRSKHGEESLLTASTETFLVQHKLIGLTGLHGLTGWETKPRDHQWHLKPMRELNSGSYEGIDSAMAFSREDQQAAAKQDLYNNGLNYYLTLKEEINTWARRKQYLNSISPTIHCQQLRLSTDGDSIVA